MFTLAARVLVPRPCVRLYISIRLNGSMPHVEHVDAVVQWCIMRQRVASSRAAAMAAADAAVSAALAKHTCKFCSGKGFSIRHGYNKRQPVSSCDRVSSRNPIRPHIYDALP
eukprot:SAG11_NODE_1213_length_5506_cov_2.953579_3_plen_112_part_00